MRINIPSVSRTYRGSLEFQYEMNGGVRHTTCILRSFENKADEEGVVISQQTVVRNRKDADVKSLARKAALTKALSVDKAVFDKTTRQSIWQQYFSHIGQG